MPDNTDWLKLHGTLPDGGQIYAETNLANFIAEPWNAISSLAFLIPAIYWLVKLKGKYSEYIFLTFCIPFLLAGGLGSTLFHAFRISKYLLMLDYVPIFILTAAVSIYLWKKVVHKWAYLIVFALPVIAIKLLLSDFFSPHETMNISYFITGTLIFLPAMILLLKIQFAGLRYFIFSLIFFSLALFFRKIDSFNIHYLPMGTHWLWHIFGAVGSYFLSEYLFAIQNFYRQDHTNTKTYIF